MKKTIPTILTALLLASSSCSCEDKENKTALKEQQQIDIAKISESFGHVIGKNLSSLEIALDPELLAKGIKDYHAGKQPPLSENECIESLSTLQEQVYKKKSDDNLTASTTFLAENQKKEGIISLDDGKLQYKVEIVGTGETVQEHATPLIRYTGKHLDGSVFGASQEDDKISLDEVIPGFAKGIIGMKEGEKRTIFIHPDLGYGTSNFFPPNSLLTFEVEVIKANVAPSAPTEIADLSPLQPTP